MYFIAFSISNIKQLTVVPFNFDSRFSKKLVINCQLSFGLNVLVFNENKYFCLQIISACFFLLNCLIFNIKTKQ